MRPGEFWEAMRAYNEKVEADRRHLGELVRGATLRLWNPQVDKRYREPNPARFWPMPWDAPDREQDEVKRLEDLDEAGREAEVKRFFERLNHGRNTPESED